jgi:hypothetical protein
LTSHAADGEHVRVVIGQDVLHGGLRRFEAVLAIVRLDVLFKIH